MSPAFIFIHKVKKCTPFDATKKMDYKLQTLQNPLLFDIYSGTNSIKNNKYPKLSPTNQIIF